MIVIYDQRLAVARGALRATILDETTKEAVDQTVLAGAVSAEKVWEIAKGTRPLDPAGDGEPGAARGLDELGHVADEPPEQLVGVPRAP